MSNTVRSQRSPYSGPSYSNTYNTPDDDDKDDPFDVRADFDVKGPRWSELPSNATDHDQLNSSGARRSMMMGNLGGSYKPVDEYTSRTGHSSPHLESGEELVSVPVLGPEWRKGELHDMSRRGQAEIKGEKRRTAWRAWNRDQIGMCGVSWMTRKVFVGFAFLFVIALILLLYFTIPRAPSFSFYENQPFSVDNSTLNFNRSPTNFSFSGYLNLYGDASSSYLPVKFTHLEASLYDETTEKEIATGDWGSNTMPNKDGQVVLLPVDFSYSATSTDDTTWSNMYNACEHIWTGTTRTDLKFKLILKMTIVGLVTKPEVSTQMGDITCPFELASDSV